MGKLTLNRISEWNNKVRSFKIYLDKKLIGEIEDGEKKEFEIPNGNHKLVAKIDWCKSQIIEFDITENSEIVIEVSGFKYGNYILPIGLGVMLLYFFVKSIFEFDLRFLLVISFIAALFPLYYITFGKNRYIVIKELP